MAYDSQKLNDSCIKVRPHLPNIEELFDQISVQRAKDWTKELMISKTDLDYAFVQMKLSDETSRQCVIAKPEGTSAATTVAEKDFMN